MTIWHSYGDQTIPAATNRAISLGRVFEASPAEMAALGNCQTANFDAVQEFRVVKNLASDLEGSLDPGQGKPSALEAGPGQGETSVSEAGLGLAAASGLKASVWGPGDFEVIEIREVDLVDDLFELSETAGASKAGSSGRVLARDMAPVNHGKVKDGSLRSLEVVASLKARWPKALPNSMPIVLPKVMPKAAPELEGGLGKLQLGTNRLERRRQMRPKETPLDSENILIQKAGPTPPAGRLAPERRPHPAWAADLPKSSEPSFGPAQAGLGGEQGDQIEFGFEGSDVWTPDELINLMAWGQGRGMSDLVLTSSELPWLRLSGLWQAVGQRKVQLGELSSLLNRLTRNEAASAMVLSGVDLDFGCEIPKDRVRRLRFRGNASAVANGWGTGLSVTLRVLPDLPPALAILGVEEPLIEALFPENGLVLVTGVMGSGKSTLLAATLRHLSETTRRHIATYEAPVEFDLSGVPGRLGPVEQSEVPRHLPLFAKAARNVTRRAADAVLIGESRDPETIRSLLEAAEIGVTAYTTVHTRSVAATPGRMIAVFDRSERAQLASALTAALRVIVQQRLYPKIGGGRLAVREFLVFDQDMRSSLQQLPLERLGGAVDDLVRSKGQTLEAAVRLEVEKGQLDESVLETVLAEKRRTDV
ncbi:MAG: Flp pilus assembly complex ATPase component TadA [Deltaproteobacteria bacterium]|jgi:defect-in-organelle-trafficking protein DotB|nr:Flp pilus assembly complex ATPase component TadA [Deltaproteobacteria bacterium]